VQLRSLKKPTRPGKWDISVAGHVSAGQTSKEAAIREIQEEIGVSIDPIDLEFLFLIRTEKDGSKSGLINREFQDVYLVKKDLDISKLVLQESEVQQVRYIGIDELKQWVKENKSDLGPHPEEYAKLFEVLDQLKTS